MDDTLGIPSQFTGFRNPSTSPQPITTGGKPATAYRIAFPARRSFSASMNCLRGVDRLRAF